MSITVLSAGFVVIKGSNLMLYNNHMPLILLLSILGFLNAFYLYWQHKREVATGQKMFCLIGGDCGAVVGSKYGRTFGIKNELIGMTYYVLLSLYLILAFFMPDLFRNFIIFPKLATLIAALFPLYLLFVQAVILRMFCSWCLIAIAINILIFYFLTFSANSVVSF